LFDLSSKASRRGRTFHADLPMRVSLCTIHVLRARCYLFAIFMAATLVVLYNGLGKKWVCREPDWVFPASSQDLASGAAMNAYLDKTLLLAHATPGDSPTEVVVSEAQILPGMQVSIVWDEKKLLGSDTLMFSFPGSLDNFISPPLQQGRWYDTDWEMYCELYRNSTWTGSEPNFLDIGANIGAVTVPMSKCLAKLGPESKQTTGVVVAVEASPVNFALLKMNLKMNFLGNVLAFPYAVDERATQEMVSMNVDSTNKGHSSLKRYAGQKSVRTYQVPVTNLDTIYRTKNDVIRRTFVMKMDVEGHEGYVLRGSVVFLTEAPPCYIFAELNAEWLKSQNTPMDELMELLISKGYVAIGSVGGNTAFRQQNMTACIQRLQSS